MDHRSSLKALSKLLPIRYRSKTRSETVEAVVCLPSPVNMMSETPIERAVIKAQSVYGLAKQVDAQDHRSEEQSAARCRADRAMDDLVGFLLDNFACANRPEETDRQVLSIFENTAQLDTVNAATLASMSDDIIPFAMTRELSFRCAHALTPARWRNLPAFMARYQNSIAKANAFLVSRNLQRLETADYPAVA